MLARPMSGGGAAGWLYYWGVVPLLAYLVPLQFYNLPVTFFLFPRASGGSLYGRRRGRVKLEDKPPPPPSYYSCHHHYHHRLLLSAPKKQKRGHRRAKKEQKELRETEPESQTSQRARSRVCDFPPPTATPLKTASSALRVLHYIIPAPPRPQPLPISHRRDLNVPGGRPPTGCVLPASHPSLALHISLNPYLVASSSSSKKTLVANPRLHLQSSLRSCLVPFSVSYFSGAVANAHLAIFLFFFCNKILLRPPSALHFFLEPSS